MAHLSLRRPAAFLPPCIAGVMVDFLSVDGPGQLARPAEHLRNEGRQHRNCRIHCRKAFSEQHDEFRADRGFA